MYVCTHACMHACVLSACMYGCRYVQNSRTEQAESPLVIKFHPLRAQAQSLHANPELPSSGSSSAQACGVKAKGLSAVFLGSCVRFRTFYGRVLHRSFRVEFEGQGGWGEV